jgi:hypothetical protein
LRAALTCEWLQIPHEIAKEMSEDDVLALVEYDHWPLRHADGGPDLHWNLRPMLIADHKLKTKADAKDMAKERKVRRAAEDHIAHMQAKGTARRKPPKRSWPKRPFRARWRKKWK